MVRILSLRSAAAGGISFITAASAASTRMSTAFHSCSSTFKPCNARPISCILQNYVSFPLQHESSSTQPRRQHQLLYMSTDASNKNHATKKKKKGKGKGGAAANKLFRADKVVSTRASISRSQAFDVLKRRRIAWKKTNDSDLIPVKGPKEKIAMDAILFMDGKPIPDLPPILIAYHKPKYMLSAMQEKHSDKKHLGMVLPEQYKKLDMHPVGRLDYDTSGLLLFSMSGELTQRLLHPKHNVEKEYIATVAGGTVSVEGLRTMLEKDGVETTEGKHFANLIKVEELGMEESRAILDGHLKDLEERKENLTEEHFDIPLTNVRIAVQEGKHRMVRRMLANCKHPVIELRRERHGSVELNDLAEGEFRNCEENEIEWAEGLLQKK